MIASDEKVKSKIKPTQNLKKHKRNKEDKQMEITRPAVAGTLESSDCQVMIEEVDGKV